MANFVLCQTKLSTLFKNASSNPAAAKKLRNQFGQPPADCAFVNSKGRCNFDLQPTHTIQMHSLKQTPTEKLHKDHVSRLMKDSLPEHNRRTAAAYCQISSGPNRTPKISPKSSEFNVYLRV